MYQLLLFASLLFSFRDAVGQLDTAWMFGNVKVTIDRPESYKKCRQTILIFYALPNGNTTGMTMGKKIQPSDDWHYDIQHIRAQTDFIRSQMKRKNIVVIYLENQYLSWPGWKQRTAAYKTLIPALVDSVYRLFAAPRTRIYLNGHSGGGSFIFGYLASLSSIPSNVRRISFLDSNYGYDSTYYPVLRNWLKNVNGATLNVFAYNDSIALYNGKPFVSATGGTWYRSHLMRRHLSNDFQLNDTETDSMYLYRSKKKFISFYLKKNTNKGIYHTQQVELNGFIHSILDGTRWQSKKYSYYEARAYNNFIR